jgi:AraC-like DNA-binding protein
LLSPTETDERRLLFRVDEPGQFAAYCPTAQLRPFLDCIWTARGSPDPRFETVLPNGVVEVIFNFGAPHRVVDFESGQARIRRYHHAWVAGLQDGPLTICQENGSDLLGFRFRPGGFYPWLGAPMNELTDDVLEADALSLAWHRELRERAGEATTDLARIRLAESVLLRRIGSLDPPDPRIPAALARITASRETIGMSALARGLGISHKHLIHLFHARVGLPPARLARILRFDRVVRAAQASPSPRWADLAAAHGYADQSHLVREFRAFTGATPLQYWASRTPDGLHMMSDSLPR